MKWNPFISKDVAVCFALYFGVTRALKLICLQRVRSSTASVLSVRFEVVVSLLLAPVGADKRGPKAPFPLMEIVGNTAGDLQESTRRSSGGSQVLLKALGIDVVGDTARVAPLEGSGGMQPKEILKNRSS